MQDSRFSLENIFQLRAEAFAAIRQHAAAIDSLAASLGDLDTAMQRSIDERSIDEQQELLTAARRLAALLETGVCE